MERKIEEETKNRKKMIKALSKSMSSPSRTEKFPPPLMRFLRSNVSSKSRGRSRSSPMFLRKKNVSAAVIETTQEPSSPKVTCIGQVRVRRSSKSKAFTKTSSKPKRSNSSSSRTSLAKQTPCWWVRKALCCNHFFPRFHKPRSPCPLFRKWALFFCFGYCKKVDTRDDSSSRVESIPRGQNHACSNATSDDIGNNDYTSTTFEVQVQESKEDLDGSTPPKNAFLLTRCRSAPYRSSSLASRFWGSPSKGDEDTEEKSEEVRELQEVVEQERPVSPMCRNEVVEPRFSSQSEEMESSSVDERSKVAKSIQDLRAIGGAAVHPLVLTRCKSEPARTGARLNPDASDQPCSQDNCD